jgi:arylsulfatase A-like enzyme
MRHTGEAGFVGVSCRLAGATLLRRFRAVLTIALTTAGCAADRPVCLHIADDIRRPDRAAVVFFVDGFGERQFDDALAEGRIPNITKHILSRGVHVGNAVACIPSITYAASVTFITGRLPGHHGVIANKWFEPSTGRFQNYCYIKTYQRVDDDYRGSPTIYEILGRQGRVSVNIQSAIRRGATHTIDNWALSGINWFFGNRTGVDCLVAQQFELIAQRTPLWGQWPDLIWAYFPGGDDTGHAYGPSSTQYKNAIANIDRQIGHICEALRGAGMYDRTVLCLVSDHGMAPVQPKNVFDLTQYLANKTGRRVWSNDYTEPGDEQRLLRDYDYAVAVTASRWAAIYPLPRLLTDERSDVATFAKSLDQTAVAPDDAAPQPLLPEWLAQVVNHPAVELAACSFHPGIVHILSRNGRALIVRSPGPPTRHSVQQWPPGVIVEHPDPPKPADGELSDSRAWLQASVGDRYPDLVPQIVAMFDSERAGNIALFAADGWDFSTEDPCGGHGSVLPTDMRIPMLFAGPGVDPSRRVPLGRACDLTPTLLGLLTPVAPTAGPDARVDMDGVNLLSSSPSK